MYNSHVFIVRFAVFQQLTKQCSWFFFCLLFELLIVFFALQFFYFFIWRISFTSATKKFLDQKKINPTKNGKKIPENGDTIRIGWQIQCLLYVGFFSLHIAFDVYLFLFSLKLKQKKYWFFNVLQTFSLSINITMKF